MHAMKGSLFRNVEEKVSFQELEFAYDMLRLELYKLYERTQTRHEAKIVKEIRKHYSGEILTSFWIGNRNVDIFIPGVKGEAPEVNNADHFWSPRVFKGLAIEIDGEIHNTEFKMKKDNSKYRQLHKLDIALLTIENNDINLEGTRRMISQIPTLETLSFRPRKRLLRDVYIITLLSHYKHEQILELFDAENGNLLNQCRKVLKG
ncbi:MAG: hypothetical protein HOE90_07855 [Bacteriovoracaceae bacterium]|jgi:hypothetical protein|nr:hypothetical protein [Bacteriovoracaceae bacterium]